MIPISNYIQKQNRVKCTKLKGEEQEETLEFFSYHLSLVYLCNPSFPAAIPSEMATMITGRPTHEQRKEITRLYCMTTLDLAIQKRGYSYQCMF